VQPGINLELWSADPIIITKETYNLLISMSIM